MVRENMIQRGPRKEACEPCRYPALIHKASTEIFVKECLAGARRYCSIKVEQILLYFRHTLRVHVSYLA